MRIHTLVKSSATCLAAGLAAFAVLAPAQGDPTPSPNYNIQYNGLFDGYLLYQFNNPKNTGDTLNGGGGLQREYDFRTDTPTLALAEVNVLQNARPGGFGFKTTFGVGDVADLNGGGRPSLESRFENVMQAYGTYKFGANGGGVDFGKYYSPIGFESTESNANFNETHSIAYGVLPVYNFGVRAYTQSYSGWVFTGNVVQAVFNTENAGVENDSGNVSFIGGAAWTHGKWVLNENLGLGDNKYNLGQGNNSYSFGFTYPDGVKNTVTADDANVTYNLDTSNTVAVDFNYLQTDPQSNPVSVDTKDTGLALYLKHMLTAKSDIAVRYSDDDFQSSKGDVKPWEATATYELHPATNFVTRLEYQHSGANVPFYMDSNGNVTQKAQDTIELAGIFTFGS